MIGQKKLFEKLSAFNLSTLPKSNILVGPTGCGKHTFVNEIAKKFNFEISDITDIIGNAEGNDYISEMFTNTTCTAYIIDYNNITSWISYNQGFNRLLKLLEEPTEYSYIFILCESLTDMLPTILNRCHIWRFEKYLTTELQQFANLSLDKYKILDTPGKIIDNADIIDIYITDARKIFEYIDSAIISNIFVLPEKLFYKEKEAGKFGFSAFCTLLSVIGLEFYLYKKISFNAYLLTNKLCENSKRFTIDKKKLYEGYLIDLKDELKRFKAENRI